MDTGVEWDHPALIEKYRGYDAVTGTVDHTGNWLDAAFDKPEPYDENGHGTHTMGTMVGSDGANQIGVAPGAKWIAVGVFSKNGAEDSDLIQGAQWLMAPNGQVELAPKVVNNSWGSRGGGDPWFQDMIKAWRAAGIFPVFSNGNDGPAYNTVGNPAELPEAFAVGAVDAARDVAEFSSRGPSVFKELKPEVAAPGVTTRSSLPGNLYGVKSGTSMAAPHVTGAVALILSANNAITVDAMEELLMNTATPRMDEAYPVTPNNGYGSGIIDVEAAVAEVLGGNIGTVAGTVATAGEDTEVPVIEHSIPAYTVYAGNDLLVPKATISDNVGLMSVTFTYVNVDGQTTKVEVTRESGSTRAGVYTVPPIPADDVRTPAVNYTWTATDYGGHTVPWDYSVPVVMDADKPVITHTAPSMAYEQFSIPLTFGVQDNVGANRVSVTYTPVGATEPVTAEATRTNGSALDGTYKFTIPADAVGVAGTSVDYTITAIDGLNQTAIPYSVPVSAAAGIGFFADFEGDNAPLGWEHAGANDDWQWGVPTSGPKSAASGDKVYATNLGGKYNNGMLATLSSPPLAIPSDGPAYLQFKQWWETEKNVAFDYGKVYVTPLGGSAVDITNGKLGGGRSTAWSDYELSLEQFAGQTVRIGFTFRTDNSSIKEGWYLDDIALTDTPLSSTDAAVTQLGWNPDNVAADPLDKEMTSGLAELNTDGTMGALPMVLARSLPLDATITIEETGGYVSTDPYIGSYALRLPAGSFTLTAESYGYAPLTKTVNVMNDEVLATDFMLTPIPTGTLTGTLIHSQNGQPVAGATLYLVEDANIAPVQTNAEGQFSLAALYGEYTLMIKAPTYSTTTVPITLDAVTLDLGAMNINPFVGVTGEIKLDDGKAEDGVGISGCADCAVGNKFVTLPNATTTIVGANIFLSNSKTTKPIDVEIWEMKADGSPGKIVGSPVRLMNPKQSNWNYVDFSKADIQAQGTFFVIARTVEEAWYYGLDNNTSDVKNQYSWGYLNGGWTPMSAASDFTGTWMIRAVVEQEAGAPSIVTPENGAFTRTSEVEVSGIGSPGFQVNLFNGGVKVATGTTGQDGAYHVLTPLTSEGVNVLTANLENERGWTASSAEVTVIRDTAAPALVITSPVNGSDTPREAIEIIGTVNDAYLAEVTLNGTPLEIIGGTFNKRILLDAGANVATVVATDLAGNVTTESVTVTSTYPGLKPPVKPTTPGITLTLPTGLSGTSGTIYAEDGADVTIAGYALTKPGVAAASFDATVGRTKVKLTRAADGLFTFTFNKDDLGGAPLQLKLKDAQYTNYLFTLYVK
jgi:bacillopeptidase F (M6 metalloprotease family)